MDCSYTYYFCNSLLSRTFDHNYFNLPGTCACNEYSDCTNGKSG